MRIFQRVQLEKLNILLQILVLMNIFVVITVQIILYIEIFLNAFFEKLAFIATYLAIIPSFFARRLIQSSDSPMRRI